MHFSHAALAALAAFTPLAQAVGKAIVKNNCNDNAYLWSVGGSVGPEQTLAHGQSYSETFHRDPTSGGIALKITRIKDGLYNGAPQTIFSYSLDGDKIWYDLADVFGDAFEGSPLLIKPSDGNCQSISWPNGVNPGGPQTKVCQANSDLTMTLC